MRYFGRPQPQVVSPCAWRYSRRARLAADLSLLGCACLRFACGLAPWRAVETPLFSPSARASRVRTLHECWVVQEAAGRPAAPSVCDGASASPRLIRGWEYGGKITSMVQQTSASVRYVLGVPRRLEMSAEY